MEKARKLADLEMTERHVAQGARHLARQQEIIEEIERRGQDSTDAKRLLHQFEEIQALHIAHRDRLRAEPS